MFTDFDEIQKQIGHNWIDSRGGERRGDQNKDYVQSFSVICTIKRISIDVIRKGIDRISGWDTTI